MKTDQPNWLSGVVIVLMVFCFGFSFSLSNPMMTSILYEAGRPGVVIGIFAGMLAIGMLLGALTIPYLHRYFSFKQILIASCLILIVSILLSNFYRSITVWLLLRVLYGFALAALEIISETLVIHASNEKNRGRYLSLYIFGINIACTMGPLFILWKGHHLHESWHPFAILAAIAGILALLTIFVSFSFDNESEENPEAQQKPKSIRYILLSLPFLFAVGLLAGASEEAILAFTSLFTQSLNYSERLGEIALVIAILGGAIGQLPLGWVIDRYERRPIWLGLFIIMIASSGSLIFFSHIMSIFWVALFFLAFSAFSLTTITLVEIGDQTTSGDLVTATSLYTIFWGVGGFLGPAFLGLFIDGSGLTMMPILLAMGGFVFAILYLIFPKPAAIKPGNRVY